MSVELHRFDVLGLRQDLTFQRTSNGQWSAKLKVEVACATAQGLFLRLLKLFAIVCYKL